MAKWDKQIPESMMERLQGILEGEQPEQLKNADEYGRTTFDSEAPADTVKRMKDEEA
jgi:hypothetical protein